MRTFRITTRRLLLGGVLVVAWGCGALRAQPNNYTGPSHYQANTNQSGPHDVPFLVKLVPTPKTPKEASQEQAEREEKTYSDSWMVRLTGILALIAGLQLVVFGVQARRLKQTIEKMDQIATDQTSDMQSSIAQATRAAGAMEKVAESMAVSAEAVKQSVLTNKEIAERQKLVTELQNRPYLSVQFASVIPQDTIPRYLFEIRVNIVNDGLTPAYDVRVRGAADVLPFPLSSFFSFPLPDWEGGSRSVIGPRQSKQLPIVAPRRYSAEEIESFLLGPAQKFYFWGEIIYRDAFNIERHVKFAQYIMPLQGGSFMGLDTARHNDAD